MPGFDARPFPTALPNGDLAISRLRRVRAAWMDGMWRADPLADAVVEKTGSREALVEHATTDPEWLERDRLDRAADVLVRYTAQWGLVLGAASLLRGADNWIAAKPLLLTGRYGDEPAVRSIEVGEWLAQVVRPGGMAHDGAGFERTLRVRMIHAHVRKHIRAARGVGRGRLGRADPAALHGVHARRVRPHLAGRDGAARRAAASRRARRHLPPVALRRARHRRRPGAQPGHRGRPHPDRGALPADLARPRPVQPRVRPRAHRGLPRSRSSPPCCAAPRAGGRAPPSA